VLFEGGDLFPLKGGDCSGGGDYNRGTAIIRGNTVHVNFILEVCYPEVWNSGNI